MKYGALHVCAHHHRSRELYEYAVYDAYGVMCDGCVHGECVHGECVRGQYDPDDDYDTDRHSMCCPCIPRSDNTQSIGILS